MSADASDAEALASQLAEAGLDLEDLQAALDRPQDDEEQSWGSPQRSGRIVQSVEFAEDNVILITWAESDDMKDPDFGQVQKTWVDAKKLDEWVITNLVNAVDDVMEELFRWRRGAPTEIPSRFSAQ